MLRMKQWKMHSFILQMFVKTPALCQAPTLFLGAGNNSSNREEKRSLLSSKFPFLDFNSTDISPSYFLCQLFEVEIPFDKHVLHKP